MLVFVSIMDGLFFGMSAVCLLFTRHYALTAERLDERRQRDAHIDSLERNLGIRSDDLAGWSPAWRVLLAWASRRADR